MKTFSFWENSISGKYLFSGNAFTRTKRSLKINNILTFYFISELFKLVLFFLIKKNIYIYIYISLSPSLSLRLALGLESGTATCRLQCELGLELGTFVHAGQRAYDDGVIKRRVVGKLLFWWAGRETFGLWESFQAVSCTFTLSLSLSLSLYTYIYIYNCQFSLYYFQFIPN